MLKVENIRVTAGNFVLDSISFEIEKGQTHVLIGPTGSGKTFLLESIIGFRKIQSGNIFLDNINIENTPIENRKIAYLPQDLALFPHLNVEQNILYSHKVNKNKEYNRELLDKLIDSAGIRNLLNRKIKNLSGGEKQRVALVRALVAESNFLILDEPFSAINNTIKNELRLLLKKTALEFKLTILFVTHDLEEAFFIADNISVISNGRILQNSPKKELYYKPNSIEVANFLGITNIFQGQILDIFSNSVIVFCPELGINLKIYSELKSTTKGQVLKLGIREENIMIFRPDREYKEQENLMRGKIILIIEKISSYRIIVKPENSDTDITVDVQNFAYKKLNISLNKDIYFSLKAEYIFVM